MRKLSAHLMIISVALVILSCAKDAEMTFNNNTDSMTEIRIDNVNYQVPAYQILERKWSLNRNLISVDELIVSVTIKEKLFLFQQEFIVKLKAGSRVYKNIELDAAGLEIHNDSFAYITEVYISPSHITQWGSNKLTGIILPDQSYQWNLTEGFWDIKVVGSSGNPFILYNQRFFIGHLHTIYFLSSKENQEVTNYISNKINGTYDLAHRVESVVDLTTEMIP